MATFKYQGKEIPVAENWRVGEQVEAENSLSIDLETAKSAARMALVLYISIRRVDKQIPDGALADQVLRMELTDIIDQEEPEEDEPGPPDEEPAEEEAGKDSETSEPQTSGVPHSASLA